MWSLNKGCLLMKVAHIGPNPYIVQQRSPCLSVQPGEFMPGKDTS